MRALFRNFEARVTIFHLTIVKKFIIEFSWNRVIENNVIPSKTIASKFNMPFFYKSIDEKGSQCVRKEI